MGVETLNSSPAFKDPHYGRANGEMQGATLAEAASDGKTDDAQRRRAKEAEKRRRRRRQKKAKSASKENVGAQDDASEKEVVEDVEIEYVPEKSIIEDGFFHPVFQEFKRIFDKFMNVEASSEKEDGKLEGSLGNENRKKSDSDDENDDHEQKLKDEVVSNKKKKMQRRMSLAELKQLCCRPDVVEVWDATAADPRLLVFLKAYRNTVPVPRHWCQKRKFLQGKRGIEKSPFHLPDFIAATGIQKIRQAYIEKEDTKKLKQKQRERMQPKTGKMDIDYQVLHDAFFKYQTKPKLTAHGDLYHEGKEYELKLREIKPGYLSRELRSALGMPDGAPPPWLINMQRYGPPPSYPQLKIPGLNAPIPDGASFGYHPGGWGKPPVDEYGRPLYGDVFGVRQEPQHYEDEPVDRSKHWGDLEEEEEEEEEEEQQEEEMPEEEMEAGIASVDTISATPTGVETPDVIDIRKPQRKEADKLYHVLEEKEEHATASALLGTTHTYVLPAGEKPGVKKVDLLKSQKTDKVDISLKPEELEGLDETALAAKFEEARVENNRTHAEDFSDMVAEAEKKRKRKAAQEKDSKAKKQKAAKPEFKF